MLDFRRDIYHSGSSGTEDPCFEFEDVGIQAPRLCSQHRGSQGSPFKLSSTCQHEGKQFTTRNNTRLTSTASPLRGLVMFFLTPGLKVTTLASVSSASASLVAILTSPSSLMLITLRILASLTAAMPSSSRSIVNRLSKKRSLWSNSYCRPRERHPVRRIDYA